MNMIDFYKNLMSVLNGTQTIEELENEIIEVVENDDDPEPCTEILMGIDPETWWFIRDKIVVCKRCGHCCNYGKIVVWDLDVIKISKHLRFSRKKFVKKYLEMRYVEDPHGNSSTEYLLKKKEDHSCVFLNGNNECNIYDVRPWNCFMFPFGVDRLFLDPECACYKEMLHKFLLFLVVASLSEKYRGSLSPDVTKDFKTVIPEESMDRLREILEFSEGDENVLPRR